MNDFRTRSYLQIATLELQLGGPPAAADAEVRRRRDMWTAIERFCWPQYKEGQFGQLEALTRTETELLAYALQSPPMRDLVAPAKPSPEKPVLPEPAPGFPDWRSRALFQISELAKLVGGPDDGEARRRAGLWLAVERYAWPQLKEQQFAQVETLTRGENDLLRYLFQMPPAKELIEAGASGVATRVEGLLPGGVANVAGAGGVFGDTTEMQLRGELAKGGGAIDKKSKAKEAKKQAQGASSSTGQEKVIGEGSMGELPPDIDPLGELSPVEKYSGPPAQWCYSEGSKAWGDFAEYEYKDKKKARAAAAKLRELFGFLDKNPESETQLKGLEEIVGLSCLEVLNGVLEKRLR